MDGDRFDALSRNLAAVSHRRRLLQTASGGILGVLVAWFDQREGLACRRQGRRCRRDRQCCGDRVCERGRCRCRGAKVACRDSCCRHCFIQKNPDESRQAFCCPPRQVCRGPRRDRCCYSDEDCDTNTGTCCRTCGNGTGGQTCCDTDEFCSPDTNRCVPFSSARLPRYRR